MGKESEKEYVYVCITESLLYSRNYYNIVSQLYFNKTFLNEKERKKKKKKGEERERNKGRRGRKEEKNKKKLFVICNLPG